MTLAPLGCVTRHDPRQLDSPCPQMFVLSLFADNRIMPLYLHLFYSLLQAENAFLLFLSLDCHLYSLGHDFLTLSIILQQMASSVSDVNVSLPLFFPPIELDSFNFSALVWPASQHLLWLVKLLFPLGGTLACYPFTSFKTYNQKFIQKLITSWTFCLFLRLLSNLFCVQPQKSWFSKYGLHLMPPWLISFAFAVCLPPSPFFESVLKNHQ